MKQILEQQNEKVITNSIYTEFIIIYKLLAFAKTFHTKHNQSFLPKSILKKIVSKIDRITRTYHLGKVRSW